MSASRDWRRLVAKWCIAIWLVAFGFSLVPRLLFNLSHEIGPIKEYRSPDGEWILATYMVKGGIASETDFRVSLRPAGTRLRHYDDQIIITEYATSAEVAWKSSTQATVTFVTGFGYFGPDHGVHIHNQPLPVEVTINFIDQRQIVEKPLYTIFDADSDILVLARISQHQLDPPMNWRTELKLARAVKETDGSTTARYERVLVIDGQYDVIPVNVSTDGVTLTLPRTARGAELDQTRKLLNLPIKIVYAE